jgi:Pyrimidine operon attenuation protein/uracil phosphoribosyltransferase
MVIMGLEEDKGDIIINENDLAELVKSIADQIVKDNKDLSDLVLVGIITNGVPLAERISHLIQEKTNVSLPVGKLDVGFYRDDILDKGNFITIQETSIPYDLTNKTVIIVDDVLHHGRTIRAALDGLVDFGRPNTIRLAVLIDRGQRELPIQPDYLGQSIDATTSDYVNVSLVEVQAEDFVAIQKKS